MTQPVTGSFTATGQSQTYYPAVGQRMTLAGQFNIFLNGTGVASIQLEKTYDNGTTWHTVTAGGTQLYQWSYNSVNMSDTASEPEAGIGYRLNCTGFTSGTVNYRLGSPY